MSKRDLAKTVAGKLVLDVLSNSFVNNEPESSSSSSSPPRESQSARLKSAQEDLLEHFYAKNQFPSDDGYAELAKMVKKSVQERREKENNHNVKCYKRPISDSVHDSIMDVDLEVDSEVDSEDSIHSVRNEGIFKCLRVDLIVKQNETTKKKKEIDSSGQVSDLKVEGQDEMETPLSKSPDESTSNLVKLETLLDPYLTNDGSIASHNDIPQILKIMSKRRDYLDKYYSIDLLSNQRNTRQIMEMIAKKMGLILLRVWLSSASKDDNGNILTEVILKLLKRLPTPSFEDLKQSKIGNAVKLAGNAGTLDVKNLADSIQTKWLQHIKKEKDSVGVKSKSAASGPTTSAGKPAVVKLAKPAIAPQVSSQVEKKTVTAISFDIFKNSPAASLPKIKKADRPTVVKKSPEASPAITAPPSVPKVVVDGSDSQFSYRRSDQDVKRKTEDGNDIPKKKRKSVRFKPDDSLKEIRFYVPDSSEMYAGSNENNHNFDKEEFTYAKSHAFYKDELKEAKEWSPPELYCFEDETTYTWGELSEERNIQNEREKKSFQSLYFKLEDIPDSPAEPDPEHVTMTAVKPIPFEEFHSQNPNAMSAIALAAQSSQRVPNIVPQMGYQLPAYSYPSNLAPQAWQTPNQYPQFNQINPPRFVNQSNFYQGQQAQNNFYPGNNTWGNSYQRPVCENYKMGICTNGSQCPNLHIR